MQKVGLWHISDGRPHKIQESSLDLEQQLEEWIEADPNLLPGGLSIVGRQIEVEGGRLDLLALDPQGRWVVIEIKRGILRRETIAQILDYASCLATLPAEELQQKVETYLRPRGRALQALLDERDAQDALTEARELSMFVVGTGKASGLDRMVSFLSDRCGVPISLVSFDVFELTDGQRILAREITEPDTSSVFKSSLAGDQMRNVEQMGSLADHNGIGPSFRAILKVAEQCGLYPRAYKRSIMYTPPKNRNRLLFTVGATPSSGNVRAYISPQAFAEFYPISEEEATTRFGEDGWHDMNDAQVEQFTSSLRAFFQRPEPDLLQASEH
jgi:hypothetical protein